MRPRADRAAGVAARRSAAAPVGLEFGQAFARFGSKVTMVDAHGADRGASGSRTPRPSFAAALEDEGIELITNAFVTSVRQRRRRDRGDPEPAGRRPSATVRASKHPARLRPRAERRGARPRAVGVETTKLGIAVDEHMRTSVEGIWAAGDVTAVAQFTPVAQYQARVAVDDMFGGGRRGGLLGPADGDLHRPGARAARADRGRGAGAGIRGRDRSGTSSGTCSARQYTDTKRGLYKLVFDGRSATARLESTSSRAGPATSCRGSPWR